MIKIVISGVNLVEGGILSILQDCLKTLSQLREQYDLSITVLLHNKNLVEELLDEKGFHFNEYPEIKSSWLKRIYFEYVKCRKISEQIKPDIWLSLHDITPNVNCKFQVVYCHNPSPFYKLDKSIFFYDIKFSLFCIFYKYLYQINIKKNAFVIIQQNWIRSAFREMYDVDTIIAYPVKEDKLVDVIESGNSNNDNNKEIKDEKIIFFYPSIPRVFKNFEIICEAVLILEKQFENFEFILTLNGTENTYAKKIFQKYSHIDKLKFIGIQKREIIDDLYDRVDCLVFPSKLETWGLPISEFKAFNKPILLSNLPYARENIGDYPKAKFFDPLNAEELASCMLEFINKKLVFDNQVIDPPGFPFFTNWNSLLRFLISERNKLRFS